jgi:hypothetical protein
VIRNGYVTRGHASCSPVTASNRPAINLQVECDVGVYCSLRSDTRDTNGIRLFRPRKRKSSGSFYMPFRGLNRKRSNFPCAGIKLEIDRIGAGAKYRNHALHFVILNGSPASVIAQNATVLRSAEKDTSSTAGRRGKSIMIIQDSP